MKKVITIAVVLLMMIQAIAVFTPEANASIVSPEITYIPISGTYLRPRPILIEGLNESEYPTLIKKHEVTQLLQIETNTYVIDEQENFWASDDWFYSDGIDNDGDGVIDDFDESMYQLSATCSRVGSHSYVFVEDGEIVSDANLDYIMNQFDNVIYPTNTATFGSEPNPGIDNDARVFILLMDIRDRNYHDRSYQFYIGGYFWSLHEHRNDDLAPPQAGYSNEKEIIHIDLNPGDEGDSGGTMAHEFQHMIHWNQDSDEDPWIDEGCADYAEYVCYGTHPLSHINALIDNPNTQLNFWGGTGTQLLAHYGASYLFVLYLAEKYGGAATIGTLVSEDANGIAGADATLSTRGYTQTFHDVFTTWTIANYLDNTALGNLFGYTSIDINVDARQFSVPSAFSQENPVEEYASEYIEITPPIDMTMSFDGNWQTGFLVRLILIEGATIEIETIDLNWLKDGSFEVLGAYDRIALIITRLDDWFGDGTYTVTLELSFGLDLIFTIDTTGSMWDDIGNVKTSASAVVNEIDAEISNYRVAIVDYRDFPVYPYGGAGDYAYHDVLPFSSDKASIIAAIQSISLGWGADWQESVYSALMHSIDSTSLGGWRGNDEAAKVIILMGDAPPHDPEPFTGYTLSTVIDAAEEADPAHVYPIQIGGVVSTFEEIAEQTGGQAFTAESAQEVVDTILEALEVIAQAPVAEAGPDQTVYQGETVALDGSGSFDPDGTIVLYEWDPEGDGTYEWSSSTTGMTTHVYGTTGAYYAILRTTDDDGLQDTDFAIITVEEPPDGIPPTTTLSVGEPVFVDPLGNICVSCFSAFTLTAEDNPGGTGVASTFHCVYNVSYSTGWLEYSAPFCLTGLTDGEYSVDYYSTDNVGNTELTQSIFLTLDNSEPLITIENPPPGWALQDGVTFVALSTDASGTRSLNFSIREANGDQGIPVGFEDMPATYNTTTGKWELFFNTLQLPDGFYIALVSAQDNLEHTASILVPYSIRNWAVLELLPATPNNKAGRTMPVKFALRVAASVDPNQPFVYNEELTIKIYATDNPNSILQTSMFGDTARDYRINALSERYITNFQTLKTPKTYMVEIWRKNMLIGTFGFLTVK